MCQLRVWTLMGCLLLISLLVQGAPLKEEGQKKSNNGAVTDVEGNDQDLQDLLDLVQKQSQQDDVMVHREHVTHIENNNGQSVKVEQKEEKVLDTETGEVLSDVKQQVKSTAPEVGVGNPATASGDVDASANVPHTVVETEVDVPSAGVHETFVETPEVNQADDGQSEEAQDAADDSDLSPEDIAAYLYASQQFNAFYNAMNKLVNESKMSAEDAEAYTKAVAMEYERLQLNDLEDRYVLERRSYPQIPQTELYGLAPGYDLYPQPVGVPEPSDPNFDMLAYVNSLMGPEEQDYLAQKQAQADLLNQDTVDPYQFVAALWNEAYENGNQEAQEIVRLLYDRVSHDSNPDDMAEIRDILLDTVAQSLDDAPYTYDTPMDTPLNLPQLPINQEGAGPSQTEAGDEEEEDQSHEGENEAVDEESNDGENGVEEEIDNEEKNEEEADLSSVAADNGAEEAVSDGGSQEEEENDGESSVEEEANTGAEQKQ